MDFGKDLLKKYGWKEGDGLGKNNDGINKPVRANLKIDKTGLGFDQASDFNNHWWERVYNDATNNIDVKNESNVAMSVKSHDSFEISTKDYNVSQLKKLNGENSYNNFLKRSTLSASGESENPNPVDLEKITLPKYQPLTDEDLFAACGGRTAHKAARHGLKLSGKLARIEQQEKELLYKMQNRQSAPDENSEGWQCVGSGSSKNKKRKRKYEPESMVVDENNSDELTPILDNTEYVTTSKKKKKKKVKLENELSSCLAAFSVGPTSDCSNGSLLESAVQSCIDGSKKRKKNKKKRDKTSADLIAQSIVSAKETLDEMDDQLTTNSLEVNISDSEQSQSTKKTKRKKLKKDAKKIRKLTSTLEHAVLITD